MREASLGQQHGGARETADKMGVVFRGTLADVERMRQQKLSHHQDIYIDDAITGGDEGQRLSVFDHKPYRVSAARQVFAGAGRSEDLRLGCDGGEGLQHGLPSPLRIHSGARRSR